MFGARVLAAAVVATTLLAACGGGNDPSADAPAVGPVPAPSTTAVPAPLGSESGGAAAGGDGAAVPAALDFTAPLLDGGEIEMGRYAGRPVLLWFWAPW